MQEKSVKVYPWRWMILVLFMLVAAANQLAWITFAPVTTESAAYFGRSELMIGMLSMVFMIVYVLIALPSAWIIDTRGFKAAVGIGAVLTAVGAIGRGLCARSFKWVFIFQVLIAVGQPLVIGSITKLAARWFPEKERATAAGLGTLAIYLGILVGLVLTPVLLSRYGMTWMLLNWGVCALAAAFFFITLTRERPPTPSAALGTDERTLVFDGLKRMFMDNSFVILMVVFFVGLGMFNGVTTWIEQIIRPRGFTSSQAGVTGGLMLVGGIVGAVVIPVVSDTRRRRKPFILLSLAGLLPGLAGIAFARNYGWLLISSFFFGFFLLSSGPVGFQYGAEISRPAPEGTSNSFLILMGQVSGILFIYFMDAMKAADGSMTVPLLCLMGCTAACLALSLFLRESPIGGS
jgi:MFS family permease